MAAKKRLLIDPAEIGSKGGTNRAKNMSKKERSEAARLAARARWDKEKGEKGK
jgi:hypothetical protein